MKLTPKPTHLQLAVARAERGKLERVLAHALTFTDLPDPVREYQGIPGRRFRFDLAWPDVMLAVEVQGGIWRRSGKGAHTGGAAVKRDAEKMQAAILAGWVVLPVTTSDLSKRALPGTVDTIVAAYRLRAAG